MYQLSLIGAPLEFKNFSTCVECEAVFYDHAANSFSGEIAQETRLKRMKFWEVVELYRWANADGQLTDYQKELRKKVSKEILESPKYCHTANAILGTFNMIAQSRVIHHS